MSTQSTLRVPFNAKRGTARSADVSAPARTHFRGVPREYRRVHPMRRSIPRAPLSSTDTRTPSNAHTYATNINTHARKARTQNARACAHGRTHAHPRRRTRTQPRTHGRAHGRTHARVRACVLRGNSAAVCDRQESHLGCQIQAGIPLRLPEATVRRCAIDRLCCIRL